MFFVNAAGLGWGVGDYILLAVVTLLLSLGSSEYCSTGECKNISNYEDLTALEEKNSAGESNTPGSSAASDNAGAEEEIELC